MNQQLNPDSPDLANVLCVDDLPEVRRTVCRTLRASGHVVVEAEGGRMALDAAASQRFDVVLTDVMMPDIDGLQLLRCLRERDLSLPVVLMSALPTEDTARQAAALGAFAYLAKPVTPELLQATIASALDARRSALSGPGEKCAATP